MAQAHSIQKSPQQQPVLAPCLARRAGIPGSGSWTIHHQWLKYVCNTWTFQKIIIPIATPLSVNEATPCMLDSKQCNSAARKVIKVNTSKLIYFLCHQLEGTGGFLWRLQFFLKCTWLKWFLGKIDCIPLNSTWQRPPMPSSEEVSRDP